MNILDLPPELITLCFSYLKGPDLAVASQTCSLFHQLITYDKEWQIRCRIEYGLESVEDWNATFKEVYGKVLHRYGRLIGLWRNTTSCYGGLIHVWYGNGEMLGEELYGLKNVSDPLTRKTLFRIFLDDNKNVTTAWKTEFEGQKPCVIDTDKGTDSVDKFSLHRDKTEVLEQDDEDKASFLAECEQRGTHRDLCWYRWQSHVEHQFQQDFERLKSGRFEPDSKLPIQPGLFKGMYGGHGTEVIHLYHENNGMFGQKISGDPNVPAGEISVRFTLNDHMTLNRDQQRTVTVLQGLFNQEGFSLQSYNKERSSPQPFLLPAELIPDGRHTQCPDRCLARFAAQGTVSPMGYRNPTLIPVHFVVFSEDLFGVLWIGLNSFSLFARVKEELPALTYARACNKKKS